MPEYAGYVSPESRVDWSKAFGGLAQKISDVGANIKKERSALDALKSENETIVNSYEPGKSQTLNEMVLRGANDVRSKMKEWNDQLKNGQLKPEDYKTNMANIKEYWGVLANSAKTFDQRFEEIMARQEPDENGYIPASSFEMELLDRFGQMADVSNNSVQVGSDGRVYLVKKDKNGNIVGDIMDIRTMNSPQNIYQNRIDVESATNNITKDWDPWTIWSDLGKGSELTITDVRQNPVFNDMKAKVAESIAPNNNPRSQVSVLVDNGVIDDAVYYLNDEEYKQKKQEAIDDALQLKITAGQNPELSREELDRIENSMVRLAKDQKGVINPVLTPWQQKAAKDRVMQSVEMQLSRKIEGSPQQRWSSGGGTRGSSGGGSTGEKEGIAGYQLSQDAINTVPVGATSANDPSGVLTTLGAKNPGLKFRKTKWGNKTGIVISKYNEDKKEWVVLRNVLNARDLAPYIYGTSNIDKALNTWDEADQSASGNTQGTNKGTSGINWGD